MRLMVSVADTGDTKFLTEMTELLGLKISTSLGSIGTIYEGNSKEMMLAVIALFESEPNFRLSITQ